MMVATTLMKRLALLLMSGIFLTGGQSQAQQPSGRAEQARKAGLPIRDEFVRASGWAMMAGALALQFAPLRRLAALALALQLLPITYVGHAFWQSEPGQTRMMHRTHFFKNLAIIGGLLWIASNRE